MAEKEKKVSNYWKRKVPLSEKVWERLNALKPFAGPPRLQAGVRLGPFEQWKDTRYGPEFRKLYKKLDTIDTKYGRKAKAVENRGDDFNYLVDELSKQKSAEYKSVVKDLELTVEYGVAARRAKGFGTDRKELEKGTKRRSQARRSKAETTARKSTIKDYARGGGVRKPKK